MSPQQHSNIDELLGDRLIQAVMRADRVDPLALRSLLGGAAQAASPLAAPHGEGGGDVLYRAAHRLDAELRPRRRAADPPARPDRRRLSRRALLLIAGCNDHGSCDPMVGFFIQRPIFASAIAAILVLAGAICYFLLPVSQFPEITPPQIVVSANYPGAGAQVVADTVTTPLEEQINGVEGMTYMSSSSSNDGSSTITVTFNVGYPLDIAAVDVQNRVSQAASSLPAIVNQGGVTIRSRTRTSS